MRKLLEALNALSTCPHPGEHHESIGRDFGQKAILCAACGALLLGQAGWERRPLVDDVVRRVMAEGDGVALLEHVERDERGEDKGRAGVLVVALQKISALCAAVEGMRTIERIANDAIDEAKRDRR